jgi:hypothetical protein
MQIGDHVVLIDDNWRGYFIVNEQRWSPPDMKYPVKDVVYTIRDIGTHLSIGGEKYNIPAILLEEIHNAKHPSTGHEVCFLAKRFRKVELPPDLQRELEEVLTLQNV